MADVNFGKPACSDLKVANADAEMVSHDSLSEGLEESNVKKLYG